MPHHLHRADRAGLYRTHEGLHKGPLDAVAFGTAFLADPGTFYTPGAKDHTDDPTMEAAVSV